MEETEKQEKATQAATTHDWFPDYCNANLKLQIIKSIADNPFITEREKVDTISVIVKLSKIDA